MTKLMILRSKKGMTLMELLIALMILFIIIPVVSVCIFSAIRQYAWSKSYADMCGVVATIDSTIERELALSSGARIEDGKLVFYKNGTQSRNMYTQDTVFNDDVISVLYVKDRAIFDPTFYKEVSVNASFDVLPDKTIQVTITYTGVSVYVSTFVVDPF